MSESYDWKSLHAALIELLRLEATPLVMQWFEKEADLERVPKVRTSTKRFSPCQMIGQTVYFNWTVAVLGRNIHANYCRAIHGMFERDEKFYSGKMFENVWYGNAEAAKAHHGSLTCAPPRFEAMAMAPLASGRLPEPDVCALYVNSAQAFLLLCGLTFTAYTKLDFTFSGESTCADSWVRTFVTGKPSVSIPCFAERKFGGVRPDQILVTLRPEDLVTAVEGVRGLSANGLRYPIPPYSISADIMEGLPASYAEY